MPYQMVKTKEYLCTRCGYKWIARKNGIDKPKPKFCPKCKTWMWDRKPIFDIFEKDYVVAGDPNPSESLLAKVKKWNEEQKQYRLRNSNTI